MHELFCKRIEDEVMPAIRVVIAENLYRKGYKQVQIASFLGTTQPAIVNYKYKLRGKLIKKVKSNRRLMDEINKIQSNILDGKGELVNYTCRICEIVREEQILPEKEMRDFVCAKTL